MTAESGELRVDADAWRLHPRRPGERAWLDAVTAAVVDLWRRARAGGRRPPSGG